MLFDRFSGRVEKVSVVTEKGKVINIAEIGIGF